MIKSPRDRSEACRTRYPLLRKSWLRSAFLFTNFLLILMALYHLKPASRSLFIEFLGADRLPYVWIGTASVMMLFIPVYHRMVARFSRFYLVLGSCAAISGMLMLFFLLLSSPGPVVAAAFYIFVDIISVVLVEQFWSLTNSMFTTEDGKRWYGLVGTGGLIGGVAGGAMAAFLIEQTALKTAGLLWIASGIVGMIFVLTWGMARVGLYCEVDEIPETEEPVVTAGGWRALCRNRYILLIAGLLLLAQLASPLIDYQFLIIVEETYPGVEDRTAFLSMFMSLMGLVSIVINLALTPLIHRHYGVILGLMIQPLMMSLCAFGFLVQPTLYFGAAEKISDRGLAYSINRASKELLYIPVSPVLIYQAKAWIDMFGYRLFKVLGSFIILLFTRWPFHVSARHLSWFTICICFLWLGLIVMIRTDYRVVARKYV